ncbi:unnamed protein product [Enterobius vermicularis]|uniref:MTP_lip_bd domain-containing protein n=1 Tax=Enterobius vermicularis TaxID=51028 RepID=A0A0N4VMP9_ENTVE|nr:unnamed protein product [Enterobius vermicularis]
MFNYQPFKRSHLALFKVSAKQQNQISIDTEGLDSVIGSSSDTDDKNADEEIHRSSTNPEASAQLLLFANRQPPVKLFNSYSQLMSAVWNANGEPFNAYETNIVFRQYHTAVPLLSGLVAKIQFGGAVNLNLNGSVYVSLWNRNAQASLIANVSASLEGSIKLSSAQLQLGETAFRTGMTGSVTTDLHVDFAQEPYLFCTVVGQGPLQTSHLFSRSVYQKHPSKRLRWSRTEQPYCYALNDATTKMCSLLPSNQDGEV